MNCGVGLAACSSVTEIGGNMKRQHSILSLVVVIFALSVNGAWAAQENTKPVENCTTITQPGSYFLGNNIAPASTSAMIPATIGGFSSFACILIASDFVTLDLAGYTIFGPSANIATYGISTDIAHVGITVENGTVTKFTVAAVNLEGSSHAVAHIRAINNNPPFGTGIQTGADGRVIGNIANNNGQGIIVTCPSVVLENMAANNDISIFEGTDGSPNPLCTNFENNPAP
jgi:hypothetical protein